MKVVPVTLGVASIYCIDKSRTELEQDRFEGERRWVVELGSSELVLDLGCNVLRKPTVSFIFEETTDVDRAVEGIRIDISSDEVRSDGESPIRELSRGVG